MKRTVAILSVFALLVAFSATAMAQDPLSYFPADNDMIISVDLQKMVRMLPAENLEEMRTESIEALGFDITPRLKHALVSMKMHSLQSNNPHVTGLFMADISMDDILSAAAKDGKMLLSENIAGFTAYHDPADYNDEDKVRMYFAQVAAGTFVFGSKESLESFKAVSTGAMANATTNAELSSLAGKMNTGSMFSMAGVLPNEMRADMGAGMPMFADLTNMVVNVDSAGADWMYDIMVGSPNQDSLNLMKGMIDQYIPMIQNSDPSGMATEVINNMSVEVQEGFLRISGKVMESTIKSLSKQMAPFMGNSDGF